MIVVKVGGAVVDVRRSRRARRRGRRPRRRAADHGGDDGAGLSPTSSRGRRVTDASALPVVRETLLEVNRELCDAIGPRAVGLVGDEIGLRRDAGAGARPRRLRRPEPPAGDPRCARGRARPGRRADRDGPLNVNADEAASALALGLGAERIVFHTDVPGVIMPRISGRRRRSRCSARTSSKAGSSPSSARRSMRRGSASAPRSG